MKKFLVLVLLIWLGLSIVLLAQEKGVETPPSGVTKEMLEKRIEELEQQKMQLLANINAVNGALQEDKAWLNNLKLGITTQKEEKK